MAKKKTTDRFPHDDEAATRRVREIFVYLLSKEPEDGRFRPQLEERIAETDRELEWYRSRKAS